LQKVDNLPDDLRELVVSSASYPFYVEELIKMLIEDKVIERGQDSERWQIELAFKRLKSLPFARLEEPGLG
jgi:predicted ATPase